MQELLPPKHRWEQKGSYMHIMHFKSGLSNAVAISNFHVRAMNMKNNGLEES
jgi:hypothetical protein